MPRRTVFALYFLAVFLQAGAYGLTFLLPDLFSQFQANEKNVGQMLAITALVTLITVYYSGHLSDRFGRVMTLAGGCFAIALALFLYGIANRTGPTLILASASLGAGWGLTYALAPVVLTRLVKAEERVRSFALLSIFVMAGFGLSPVMASAMLRLGLTVNDAFYVTAALCAVSGVILTQLVGPIRAQALNPGPEAASRLSLTNIAQILHSPARLPVTMVFLGASVFAGMTNFQTVIAGERGLDYASYFLTYTVTVVFFRILLARFTGGPNRYLTISAMQYVMAASILLFLFIGGSAPLYILVAVLFGLGYGASYPILVAMAANDARDDLVPQTLQLFALTYFIGIFGFPLIAGWVMVELGSAPLLWSVTLIAAVEASLALRRALANARTER